MPVLCSIFACPVNYQTHVIVGRRPYIKNRDIQPIVITLGEYVCKRHAEWVYKDLMGSMGSGSTYSMPDPLQSLNRIRLMEPLRKLWNMNANGKKKRGEKQKL